MYHDGLLGMLSAIYHAMGLEQRSSGLVPNDSVRATADGWLTNSGSRSTTRHTVR